MNKLKKLTDSILKDGKMNSDTIIEHLTIALCDCECGEMEHIYKKLYEDAFGTRITKDIAEEWVHSMLAHDTADGQKWTMENTTEYGNKVNIDWTRYSKVDFYIVMNMMYSDYYRTAKTINMASDNMFFANLSKDWLCDSDVSEDKLYKYYFDVVV
jgi:hypothetical protein